VTLVPGAVFYPGAHWNYEAGQIDPSAVFWHYTVGNDSRALIANQGLAPILVRDDIVWQFAPLDACCYTQCEWNRVGPGLEVESLDGSITPDEVTNLGYVTLFALTTYGIPANFYDGPRLPVGTPFRGVTNHRNLVHRACDQHFDGFDEWVWDAAMTKPTPHTSERHDGMTVCWVNFNGIKAYLVGGAGVIIKEFRGAPGAYGFPQDALDYANGTNCGLAEWNGDEWVRALRLTGLVPAATG